MLLAITYGEALGKWFSVGGIPQNRDLTGWDYRVRRWESAAVEIAPDWIPQIPPSYALAMLCHPGLAIAKAIASWDHRHHGFTQALHIQALILARSRLLSQPP